MVYRTLYYLVNVLIRVFYRKLYVNGLENIDTNKTYLITSNHPNGFFEPLIMACTFPIDLHFMVRGDMFEKPIMNWFLRSTHQIPIFRFVDGYAKMKENKSSLAEATATLKKGNSIMLFAEGSTKALMRCRSIQKGTAKMAFQAFEDYPDLELEILPVGINFNIWKDPGNEVIVNIGKPFNAKSFFDDDVTKRPKGIRDLTKKIEVKMKDEIIHLEEKENEDFIRKLWTLLNLRQKEYPRKTEDKSIYLKLKTLANNLNQGVSDQVKDVKLFYEIAYEANGNKIPLGIKKMWKYLLIIPGLIGALFHLIPVSIGYYMRNNKVKRDAFAAPVLGITSFLLSIVFYIITFIVVAFIWGLLNAVWVVLSVMICGFCFVLFWENSRKVSRSKLPDNYFADLENVLNKL